MLDEFDRYAVYWVPARPDRLATFGASWMGWCAEAGETQPRTADAGNAIEITELTRLVSRHGFHGVIQVPFGLREGSCRWSVEHALGLLAEELVGFQMPRLELGVVDERVALVPVLADTAQCAALIDAVARVRAALAPLSESRHVAKPAAVRGAGGLRQLPTCKAHEFHAPLTDRTDLTTAYDVAEELRPWLKSMLAERRQLADLALMGDPGGGRPMRVLQRFELRETPRRAAAAALPTSGKQTLVQALASS